MYTIINAKKIIIGNGEKPLKEQALLVKGDKIVYIGEDIYQKIPSGSDFNEINLEYQTLLPGLVDTHIHLTLGTYGGYSEIIREPDSIHLLAGAANAKKALYEGITTMMDAGSRNLVAQDLRNGINMGIIEGPRLFVAGKPLTITGGHFHFCNDNEADGIDQVIRRVRQFVKENADFVKIMASGGGSANIGSLGGPNASQVAFNLDELIAAVNESHKLGRITTAHCEAFESVGNAAEAGVDILCHCGFILPDGSRGFDVDAVKIMAEKELYYNPTLQTGSERYDELRSKKEKGDILTYEEEKSLESIEYKYKRKFDNLIRMKNMGVKIIAGSDATGLGNSTRLIRTMELMVDAGMTPMEVISSATSVAAHAFNLDKLFGEIKVGLKADLIAVDGNPDNEITALRNIKFCMKDGKIILNHIN
jgi:imidazolonepropionase-like amidohydrolase